MSGLPRSTYRLQLSSKFGFDAVARLVPYLKALGISHVYASPFLKARPGSSHGYDIVDHNLLNPEFGGEDAFRRLSEALREADLGLILDFVPNHMGIGSTDNRWWLDVLEWGQRAPHARAFDIAWDLLPFRRSGVVLLPLLGRPYGQILENGELKLQFNPTEGSFFVSYFEHRFPITPPRYGEILKHIVAAVGANEPTAQRLLKLANAFADPKSPNYREAPEYKRAIARHAHTPLINRGLAVYYGDSAVGRQALHRLLERQHYRLAYWRVAVSSINYRRFFDINDLAGLRVEDPQVFQWIHPLVSRMIAQGQLQGLRIDHIDGLRDPAQYTRRLADLVRSTLKSDSAKFHLTVEKILGEGENLPHFPGVHGTTGYEWLNAVSRVLVNPDGLAQLDKTWREFTGERQTFKQILRQAKRRIIETILASEFNVLAQMLGRIAAGHYATRDFTPDRIRAALQSYVLEFPFYRTYITATTVSAQDRAAIETSLARARDRWPGSDPEIFDFLRDVITLDLLKKSRSYSRPKTREFAFRLQQFTGPLMAKSLEDTAFYRYHHLLALNEVGNDPSAGAIDLAAFHAGMSARSVATPFGLSATATHDTKRGEDARMRILALSELSGEWASFVTQLKNLGVSQSRPARAHEYMIYQTLVGAWPSSAVDRTFIDRIKAYAVKAAREGKEESSWINVNERYERTLTDFIEEILGSEEFIEAFARFVTKPILLGALNSLSQLVLKTTAPGVPDFYQGTENWDLSLVDPDNRGAVDFASLASELGAAGSDWVFDAEEWPSRSIKLRLTARLLAVRNEYQELFSKGAYDPLEVAGPDADNVIAFRRRSETAQIVVAVGRHFGKKTAQGIHWPKEWSGAIKFDGGNLVNKLSSASSGDPLELCNLFAKIPVALLATPGGWLVPTERRGHAEVKWS